MKTVLLAGGTGYLGKHIWTQLLDQGYQVRALVRNPVHVDALRARISDVRHADITRPSAIVGCCDGIDTVISTVGITHQKDGLTYMDVDFQANINLLDEARRSGVSQFIYVSVLNGERLRHLKLCEAKERFVDALKQSGLDYQIIRPNGFFSDVEAFLRMTQRGRIWLFGDGQYRTNPIHGADLASIIIDSLSQPPGDIRVGGPQTLTHNDIARLAFEAVGRPIKVTYLPDCLRTSTLFLSRHTTSSKTYGPLEFFLTVMAMNMVAPECGEHSLEKYFKEVSSFE